MAGQPVKIIEIVKTSRQNSRMAPREEVLSAVLKKAGDNKICLIATVGASRLGKSCFLNYIAKYLAHHEEGSKEDWLPPENTKAITGFPFKNTTERQTIGFWIWDKPFNIRASDGSLTSVFLMDTQGVFDEETMTEWSAIFGLALLTSSFLIYNINFNPQEICLEVLEIFLQFGLMSMEKEDGDYRIPFQKLLFLVRDWNAADEDGYGITQGQRFLDNWLDEKQGGIPKDGAKRREDIKRCFEKMACYLLPDPGEKAKSLEFQGAAKDLSELFHRHLKSAIEELCKPKNLTIKTVEGKSANWEDVVDLFIKYTEIFNKSSNPSPHSFLEATYQSSCAGAAKMALKIFETKVTQYLKSGPGVENLSKIEGVKEMSLSAYEKINKLGSREMALKYKESLVDSLQQQVEAIKLKLKENEDEFISSLVEDGVKLFKQSFSEEIQKLSFGENPIQTEQLKKIMEISKGKVSARLDEEEALQDEALSDLVFNQIKGRLQIAWNEFLEQNKLKLQAQENTILEIVNEFCEEYIQGIQFETRYPSIVAEDKLKESEAKQRTNILRKVSSKKDISEGVKESVKQRLVVEMNKLYSNMERVNTENLDGLKKQMEELVNSLTESFAKDVHQYALHCQGKSEITVHYLTIKERVVNEFLGGSPINDFNFNKPYKLLLQNNVEDIYHSIIASKEASQKQQYEAAKTELNEKLIEAKVQLQQDSQHFSSTEEFLVAFNKYMKRIMKETEQQYQYLLDADKITLIQYLDKEIVMIRDDNVSQFQSGLEEAISRNQLETGQVLEQYKFEMEEFVSNHPLMNDLDMQSQHNHILEQLNSSICKLKNEETVNKEISKEFKKILGQARLNVEKLTVKKTSAVEQAKSLYIEKMSGNWVADFQDEQEIREIGNSCKKLALDLMKEELGNEFPLLVEAEHEAIQQIEEVHEANMKEFIERINKIKLSEIEQKIDSIFTLYSNNMKGYLNAKVLDIAAMQDFHKLELQHSIDRLSDFVSKLNLETTNAHEAQEKLKYKIKQEFEIAKTGW